MVICDESAAKDFPLFFIIIAGSGFDYAGSEEHRSSLPMGFVHRNFLQDAWLRVDEQPSSSAWTLCGCNRTNSVTKIIYDASDGRDEFQIFAATPG